MLASTFYKTGDSPVDPVTGLVIAGESKDAAATVTTCPTGFFKGIAVHTSDEGKCIVCPTGCKKCETIDTGFADVKCTERTDATDETKYLDVRGVLRTCATAGYRTIDAAQDSKLLTGNADCGTCIATITESTATNRVVKCKTCGATKFIFRKCTDTTLTGFATLESSIYVECGAAFTNKPRATSTGAAITNCLDYKYNMYVIPAVRRNLAAGDPDS